MRPPIQYARSGGLKIAYQITGGGPRARRRVGSDGQPVSDLPHIGRPFENLDLEPGFAQLDARRQSRDASASNQRLTFGAVA